MPRCDHVRPHLRRAGLGVQCARAARWLDVGAALARLLADDAPTWLSPASRATARALLAQLRDDAWGVLARHAVEAQERPGADRGQTSAAAALGVGRSTVARWARGGWLLATRGRETGE